MCFSVEWNISLGVICCWALFCLLKCLILFISNISWCYNILCVYNMYKMWFVFPSPNEEIRRALVILLLLIVVMATLAGLGLLMNQKSQEDKDWYSCVPPFQDMVQPPRRPVLGLHRDCSGSVIPLECNIYVSMALIYIWHTCECVSV